MKTKTQPDVKIVKDPEDPQPIEIMERAIVECAEGARKLLNSRLSRRAVSVLLRDATNESLATIDRVLSAAARLDKDYLKAAVLFVAVAGLSACAGLQPKAPDVKLACQTAPQWITNDAQGRPNTAIFVCFGEDHKLLWTSRQLTFDEILKLVVPPAPTAPPAAAIAEKAKPAKPAPIAKRESQSTAPAAPAAIPQAPVTPSASPAPIPTVSGTAK